MSIRRHISRGLRVLFRRHAQDDDLDREMRHYLEEAAGAFEARGLTPAEARCAARREMGDPVAVREQVRDAGWESRIASLIFDVRFAGRMLRKTPVFTLTLVLVIAIGSGAVTTIFSAMNAILLRPLPGVEAIDRLVSLRHARQDGSTLEQGSYAFYAYARDRTTTLDGVAAWGRVALTLSTGDGGTAVYGNMVSASYFSLLGVRPALGRFFAGDEDRTPGSHPVIVVSHDYWATRLGGDPGAVGRTLTVNGHPFTLVGVAPADFGGIYTGLRPDAWVPLMMQPVLRPRSDLASSSWLWMFGRLRPGTSRAAAQAELTSIAAQRVSELGLTHNPRLLNEVRLSPLTGLPGGEGREIFSFMGLLLAAAALVLLIAGVNVAAMLSARYIARDREMAVRAALGAGRGRLLRQLLTEVCILFLLGAGGGFVIAQIATAALEQLPLPNNLPLTLELSPDLRVLAFAVAVSVVAGLTFGLLPALRGARRDITTRLREDSTGAGVKRSPVMRALIVGQLALSFVLLVAAGLFTRALISGQRIDPGFTIDGVEAAWLEPESWGYDEPRARAFYEALQARVAALPGVTAVSLTSRVPLMLSVGTEEITVDGRPPLSVNSASVGADYFAVLRLPLQQGRAFTPNDDRGAARVTIVNETVARRIWPDGTAVGRTFRLGGAVVTIVGIARDAKYASLDERTPPHIYLPLTQAWQPTQTLLVRTAGDPAPIGLALQQAVQTIDPLLPRPRVSTLAGATGIVLLPQRAAAVVTAALGVIGLLLAAVGLYGIMSFAASRRAREIGIRVAMGAPRAQVLRMMIADGLRLATVGILLGILIAVPGSGLLARWLYDVNPYNVAAFAAIAAVLLAVSFLASYVPARRAAAIEPLRALKQD